MWFVSAVLCVSPWFNWANGSPLVVRIMATAEEDEDSSPVLPWSNLYPMFEFLMTRRMIYIAFNVCYVYGTLSQLYHSLPKNWLTSG